MKNMVSPEPKKKKILEDIGLVLTSWVLKGSTGIFLTVRDGTTLSLPKNFQECKRDGGTLHYVQWSVPFL